jgi:hypothetical protein
VQGSGTLFAVLEVVLIVGAAYLTYHIKILLQGCGQGTRGHIAAAAVDYAYLFEDNYTKLQWGMKHFSNDNYKQTLNYIWHIAEIYCPWYNQLKFYKTVYGGSP